MKVAFLYDGPHPMHMAWAESVGAVPVANRFNTRTDAAALKAAADDSSSGRSRGLDLVKSISLRALGLPASSYFQGLVQGAADIKDLDADVLILEGRMGVIPGHLFKRLRGGKVIFLAVDPFIWELRSFSPYWRRIYERILEGFDGIVADSRMMYDLLPRAAQRSAHVVLPSFEGRYLDIVPDPDSTSMAYIGALDERKGVDLSIEAFRRVRRAVPSARFLLIGKGPLREKYGDVDGVEFLGYVDDPGEHLQKCALFLHLPRFEPYGINVLEGMAAGLVPVVSEMTGMKWLLEDIDPGLVVMGPAQAASKLISLLEDPDGRRALSEKCRRAVRGWTRERSLGDFREAFGKIVGAGGAGCIGGGKTGGGG